MSSHKFKQKLHRREVREQRRREKEQRRKEEDKIKVSVIGIKLMPEYRVTSGDVS